ncbi:MAG: hypothetical protein EOP05_01100 [Proteobacteria bacterium]|nr:MAG: hypothetical protein EOP05_01100 [Pseudomonadota bacterium]
MKYLGIFIFLFLPEALNARESLFKAEVPTEVQVEAVSPDLPKSLTPVQSQASPQRPSLTNKPPGPIKAFEEEDYVKSNVSGRNFSQVPQGTSTQTANVFEEMGLLEVGGAYRARIPMSLLAFNEARTPVLAQMMVAGTELVVLGEATLERNSKRIIINFKQIRKKDSDKIFEMNAVALAQDGTPGIEAEIHSGEAKFFLAEVLSAGAAGFVDASINRTTNAFGGTNDERSLDTQSKKAVSGALSKTTERFAEKVKTAPEFATADGPVEINILVLQSAKRRL